MFHLSGAVSSVQLEITLIFFLKLHNIILTTLFLWRVWFKGKQNYLRTQVEVHKKKGKMKVKTAWFILVRKIKTFCIGTSPIWTFLSLRLNKCMMLHGSLYSPFSLCFQPSGIYILSFKGIFWYTITEEVISKSLEVKITGKKDRILTEVLGQK